MTALAKNIVNPTGGASTFHDDAAAGVHVYTGALVSIDSSGNARPGRATSTDTVRGIAAAECDNTDGSAGDLLVKSEARVGAFVNSAGGDEIVSADKGSFCYIVDDQTVAKTSDSGARPIAGVVVGFHGAKVLVAVGSAPDPSDAVDPSSNLGYLTAVVPLDADGVFYLPLPDACTVEKISTAVEAATTATSDATITAAIDTVDVTDGVVTVANGSVVGTKDSATPSAANVATAGQNLRLTVAHGTQSAAAFARVTVKISY